MSLEVPPGENEPTPTPGDEPVSTPEPNQEPSIADTVPSERADPPTFPTKSFTIPYAHLDSFCRKIRSVIPRGKAISLAFCAPALFAASLAIHDINGVPRSPLKPEGKASVLFFITSDCPISNSYAPEIQRICSEYGPKQVSCDLVYVDPDLTTAAVKKHVQDFGYAAVSAILDSSQKLVKAAGATITPEAAVIGPSGQVLYRGRIDNVYAALGKRRPEATEHDLRKALDEVLSGKPVSTPQTQAIGCYIPPAGVKR